MQVILVKLILTLYVTENAERRKNHRFLSWQNTIKVKKIKTIKTKSNNFHPIPAASTAGPCPTFISLLLQFYKNVQTQGQLCSP